MMTLTIQAYRSAYLSGWAMTYFRYVASPGEFDKNMSHKTFTPKL